MSPSDKQFRPYLAALTAVSAADYEAACVVLAAAGGGERAWEADGAQLLGYGVEERYVVRFSKLRSGVDPSELACQCRDHEIGIIGLDDDEYPTLLKEIYDPPLGLFIRGSLESDCSHNVAIVGTRRPTAYGLRWSEILGRDLGRAGITVVSGMALGIDCASHEAVLAAGGRTVAVLGRGVDKSYPASKRALFKRIIQHGAVISEFPPGMPPLPHHFPRRNRIIAGMSRGCVVVEGGLRSGSLITADLALEEGRDVFAVPGRIGDRYSKGPNSLLKKGCAKLVTTAADVLEELGCHGAVRETVSPVKNVLNDKEQTVMAAIDPAGSSMEKIAVASGLPAAVVRQTLIMLEIKGMLRKTNSGRYYSTIDNNNNVLSSRVERNSPKSA